MSNSSAVSVGRILISNDDGLDAIGIAILEEIAAKFSDDVWVIAPSWAWPRCWTASPTLCFRV